MWWKMILYVMAGLVAILAVALLYGAHRWQSLTRQMRAGLEAARLAEGTGPYRPDDLTGLPAPVQRYLRASLTDGQPVVSAVTMAHRGTFNMRESGEGWKPFTSTQRVITRRPGFDWDARIAVMPAVTVRVHDAYIAGEGVLQAALYGLVTLVEMRGTPEIAQGELMRFLAEAPWYPTALLPGQGVRWEAVDGTSAKATIRDGETTVALLFRFDDQGLIASVRAEARGRAVGGAMIPTPWEGRWGGYEVRDGMRVPTEGEVAWLLPGGPKPYWRGRVTRLAYEFAR
ncbi:MAG: DUF6544 family protein [Thermodesulfobacteriota bacterium]